MNKTIKVTLIVGSILVGIGLIVVLIAGFASGWSFVSYNWKTKVYTSPNMEITDIDVDFDAGILEIDFYDGAVVKVEYPESEQITTECSVTGQTLSITSVIRWHVQFGRFNQIPTTKVYIPREMQPVLRLRVDAGMVTVKEGSYKNIELNMNAGTLNMDSVNCNNFKVKMNAGLMNLSKIESSVFSANLSAGTLNVTHLKCGNVGVRLSAGSANVGIAGAKADYSITTDVTAGSCNVKNQYGITSKVLRVEVSAGSAKITFDN